MLVAANTTQGVVLADRVRCADTFFSRLIGLLRTPVLSTGEGLWISPCTSVHTWFMRYPIDVIFLDAKGIVLQSATMRPWRMSRIVWKSQGCLELPAGTIEQARTRIGDRIQLDARNS